MKSPDDSTATDETVLPSRSPEALVVASSTTTASCPSNSSSYRGHNPKQLFDLAEQLCEQKKWTEAESMFLKLKDIVEQHGTATTGGASSRSTRPNTASSSSSRTATANNLDFDGIELAEVYAHLGVVCQSLDRVPEAIAKYRLAVEMDPELHVCSANLASLYHYLGENEEAAVDPENTVYHGIKRGLQDLLVDNDAGALPVVHEEDDHVLEQDHNGRGGGLVGVVLQKVGEDLEEPDVMLHLHNIEEVEDEEEISP
ncbi:unnamed protein product [Amoebophrya sp. A25]|nr:unnamed protein product [Amoebophrya sp. A25]|eukprot:GSA25T00001449001.1